MTTTPLQFFVASDGSSQLPPGATSSGPVLTVFGRPGPNVVAVAGDYAASQITNDSAVAGASVAAALNTLSTLANTEVSNAAHGIAPIITGAAGAALISNGVTAAWGANFAAQNLVTTGTLSLDTTPSATGTLALAKTSTIKFRNATNTGDLNFVNFAAAGADSITFGDLLLGNGMIFRAQTAGYNFFVGATDAFSISNSLQFGVTSVAYSPNVLSPVLSHTNGASPTNFAVRAEGATSGNTSSGRLLLQGGIRAGTGLHRGPCLQLNVDDTEANMQNLVEVAEVIVGNRVLALVGNTLLTSARMPANSGDLVIYVANAATDATAAPTAGHVYQSSGGNPAWFTPNATKTTIGATGSASALPALPVAYMPIKFNGVSLAIPMYNP